MVGGESFETLKRKYGENPASASYSEMGLVEKIKKVILSPSEFFERIKAEKGIGGAFKYLAILSLINLAVGIIGFAFNVPSISPLGNLSTFLPLLGDLATVLGIVILVVIYIGGLILSFVGAGFIHLFARLLKGKGDYSATYKALIYASTPSLLLGWIPWVGIIFGIYSFYLSLKGISKLHEVSMGRALVMVFVIPCVIFLVITIALAGITYMYIASIFARKGPTTKLLYIVNSSCLADGNANIIVRNIGVSSITSSEIKVTKDGSSLTYGQFTIDKAIIEEGSTATIKAPCTTPGVSKTCRYVINGMPAIVFCVG